MFLISKSMQLSLDRVMIRILILITRGGEIIPISPRRTQLQATQPQGYTIKLNPLGSLTSLLSHTGLHNSNTGALPPRLDSNFEDQMLTMISDMAGRVDEINGRVGEINRKVSEVTQTINSHSQSIAKLEAQVGQMANSLNRR